MISNHLIEICAGSLTDVVTASAFEEVDRIELNSSLELGGITPSLSTLLLARKHTDKKIICMVRPRGAGFVYNEYEKETMLRDAALFLENGADGIVFGCLNPDLSVDEAYTDKMVKQIHSFGKEAVFHKAFDEVPDPCIAIETLIRCAVNRILTGGGHASAEEGAGRIGELQKKYGSQIELLPGGGVSEENVIRILRTTGCGCIHMTAKETLHDCGDYFAVSSRRIRRILKRIKEASQRHNRTNMTGEDLSMMQDDHYESLLYPSYDPDRL